MTKHEYVKYIQENMEKPVAHAVIYDVIDTISKIMPELIKKEEYFRMENICIIDVVEKPEWDGKYISGEKKGQPIHKDKRKKVRIRPSKSLEELYKED